MFRVPPSISQVISKAFGCDWFFITTFSAKNSAGKFEDYDRFVPNASSAGQRGQVCTFCLDVFIRRWFVAHFRCCLHQILYVFICSYTTPPLNPSLIPQLRCRWKGVNMQDPYLLASLIKVGVCV